MKDKINVSELKAYIYSNNPFRIICVSAKINNTECFSGDVRTDRKTNYAVFYPSSTNLALADSVKRCVDEGIYYSIDLKFVKLYEDCLLYIEFKLDE